MGLQGSDWFFRRRHGRRARAPTAPTRSSRRSLIEGPGSRAPAIRSLTPATRRSARSRAVPSRPRWSRAPAWPTFAPISPSPEPRSRSTSAASSGRRHRPKPLYRTPNRKELTLAEPTYPDDLRYHPEHDWARIEGDEATFGITWYAQDSLGEVVFYEPPEVGAAITEDSSYAEVESVKAVSDVIAPLSGEVTEVNEAPRRRARADQRGPLRRRLAGQGHADLSGGGRDAAGRRRIPQVARNSVAKPGPALP